MIIIDGSNSSENNFYPNIIVKGSGKNLFNYVGYLLYSWKKKHVLLFRKLEILLFKVSITNMPHNIV